MRKLDDYGEVILWQKKVKLVRKQRIILKL